MDEDLLKLDREKLKIERKIRKKSKKEKAQETNKKEREKAALLKLQSSDHRIQIISENPLNCSKPVQCRCDNINIENDIEQFPSLDFGVKQKKSKNNKHSHNENCPLNITTSSINCKKSSAPITIDIAEVIEIVKKPPINNNKHVMTNNKKLENRVNLSGNILDSDNPQRRHGKIREIKKKTLSQLKKQICKEKNCTNMAENSFKINTFCDNVITPELNITVERLLKDIADFYYRQFNDAMKTVHKKRFIVGFHEIEKYIPTKNVKLIIMASNLQPFDALYEKVNKFKNLVKIHNIQYGFALSRRHLSRCLRKQTPISCVAILNYFGSEDNYHKTNELLHQAKMDYEVLITTSKEEMASSLESKLNEKVIATLINKIETTNLSS